MLYQPVRVTLLVGVVAALTAAPISANHGSKAASGCSDCATPAAPCGSPCGTTAAAASPCAPATRTVKCTEYVSETYQAKRTVYKTECRVEKYTAYKCETVPEVRERTVCTYKQVCETRTEMRKKCVTEQVVEARTTMQTSYRTEQVTEMKCKKVDNGHYECKEVFSFSKALHNRINSIGSGHGCHKNDCCSDPCAAPACPPSNTKTVQVWVHCWTTEQVPVTVCKKVCVQTPVTCNVTVCKTKWIEEPVTVNVVKCVPVTSVEKYTVCVQRKVAVECTRNVNVCVPTEETYTACRLVPRIVDRQVACDTCNTGCDTCAPASSNRLSGFLTGLRGRIGGGHSSHGCNNCGTPARTSCGCN